VLGDCDKRFLQEGSREVTKGVCDQKGAEKNAYGGVRGQWGGGGVCEVSAWEEVER